MRRSIVAVHTVHDTRGRARVGRSIFADEPHSFLTRPFRFRPQDLLTFAVFMRVTYRNTGADMRSVDTPAGSSTADMHHQHGGCRGILLVFGEFLDHPKPLSRKLRRPVTTLAGV